MKFFNLNSMAAFTLLCFACCCFSFTNLTGQSCSPDVTAPTLSCQDITINLGPTGMRAMNVNKVFMPHPATQDNCSSNATLVANAIVTPSTMFTCANAGTSVETNITTMDDAGNIANCKITVTVVDNTAPVTKCKDATIMTGTATNVPVTVADVNKNSFDNACSGTNLILEVSPSSLSCKDGVMQMVTLTATDEAGNSGQCTATVTVLDDSPPTVSCSDITVNLGPTGMRDINFNKVFDGHPNTDDNCSSNETLVANASAAPMSTFTCAHEGSNAVTVSTMDDAGNMASCMITVTVVDNQNVCTPFTGGGTGTGKTTISSFEQAYQLQVYPNPVNDELTVAISEAMTTSGKLQMFDAFGKMVHAASTQEGQAQYQINVSNFPSGVYMVNVRAEGQLITKRVIVQ